MFGDFCVLYRLLMGIGQRSRLIDDLGDLLDLVEPTLFDSAANQAALLLIALLHGIDQWQCRFAFGQIIANVLTQFNCYTAS